MILRRVCGEAIDLIKRFEGFRPSVYLCPAGLPTVGYGHVVRRGEVFDTLTEDNGEELLRRDLAIAKRAVLRLTRVPLEDGQYGALVSFTFNVGSGNYQSSTLRMKLNRGDYLGAAGEFWKWRRARGRALPGLVKRRAAEKALFMAA